MLQIHHAKILSSQHLHLKETYLCIFKGCFYNFNQGSDQFISFNSIQFQFKLDSGFFNSIQFQFKSNSESFNSIPIQFIFFQFQFNSIQILCTEINKSIHFKHIFICCTMKEIHILMYKCHMVTNWQTQIFRSLIITDAEAQIKTCWNVFDEILRDY